MLRKKSPNHLATPTQPQAQRKLIRPSVKLVIASQRKNVSPNQQLSGKPSVMSTVRTRSNSNKGKFNTKNRLFSQAHMAGQAMTYLDTPCRSPAKLSEMDFKKTFSHQPNFKKERLSPMPKENQGLGIASHQVDIQINNKEKQLEGNLSSIIGGFGTNRGGLSLIDDISSIDENNQSSKEERKVDDTLLKLLKRNS